MAILSKENLPKQKQIIDLNGPDGNAFVLLGLAQRLSARLHLDYDEIQAEMKSSDYENLITVFDNHFGDYVDLVR